MTMFDNVPEEWTDRMAQNIRDEIIGYFEGRFTALEEQILGIRRTLTMDTLSMYAGFIQDTLARFREFVEKHPGANELDKQAQLAKIAAASQFIRQRERTAVSKLLRSRNPEEDMRDLYQNWQNHFKEINLPHPEILRLEPDVL